MATSGSIRTRVRAELTAEIKQIARAQLATEGANLSLRAVARELGMVSSGIYRYFASRDELLTALIIDAYNASADAAAAGEAQVERDDFRGRLLAVGEALRTWAVAVPAEFALIYGSPVPGYQAPADTIEPAARIPGLIGRGLQAASRAGAVRAPELPSSVRPDMHALGQYDIFLGVDEAVIARAVSFYVQAIGLISFELYGHLVGVVSDYAAFFEFQLGDVLARIGL